MVQFNFAERTIKAKVVYYGPAQSGKTTNLEHNQGLTDLLSSAELSKTLNPWNRRAFPAVASQGEGVMETFVAVVQEMLAAIAVKYNLKEKGLDPAAVPDTVAEAFATVLRRAGEAPATATGGGHAPA